jgi:alkyl hydroperoxide reductase subunit AhpF
MDERPIQFDDETWASLPDFLSHLPEAIRLHVWGDEKASQSEHEAAELARTLNKRFGNIDFKLLPRRINYNFYPVIGIMRLEGEEAIDLGVRFIGLPAGYQMTSLISAMQSVAFRGMTSEAMTRIQLKKLKTDVSLELITSAEDEAGTVMAHRACNLAVASSQIRTYIIMGDAFPQAVIRYSINRVPHLVINERVHLEGIVDEKVILEHIAATIR